MPNIMKREIRIQEIKGIRIGQAENRAAGTGCTVFLSEAGMAAGLDVRGGEDVRRRRADHPLRRSLGRGGRLSLLSFEFINIGARSAA